MANDSDLPPGVMGEIVVGFVLVVVTVYFALTGNQWPAVATSIALGAMAVGHRISMVMEYGVTADYYDD